MKKITILLIFMLCMIVSFSQPILNAGTHGLSNGDRVYVYRGPDATFTPGPSGASQLWDFTATLKVPSTVYNNRFRNPATTPEGSQFTTATTCLYDSITQEAEYYKLAASVFSLVGISDTSIVIAYTDEEKYYTYPFTYNSITSDDYAGSWSDIQARLTLSRLGHVNLKGDAWGTLKLFGYTFNNTLRVNIADKSTDIVTNIDNQDTISVAVKYTTVYQWFIGTAKYPVLIYTHLTDSLDGKLISDSKTIQANKLLMISVNDEKDPIHFSLSPNPCKSEFNITMKDPDLQAIRYSLYDINGKEILNKVIHPDGGSVIERVSMDELPAGVYSVRLMNQNGTMVRKIVKN